MPPSGGVVGTSNWEETLGQTVLEELHNISGLWEHLGILQVELQGVARVSSLTLIPL